MNYVIKYEMTFTFTAAGSHKDDVSPTLNVLNKENNMAYRTIAEKKKRSRLGMTCIIYLLYNYEENCV